MPNDQFSLQPLNAEVPQAFTPQDVHNFLNTKMFADYTPEQQRAILDFARLQKLSREAQQIADQQAFDAATVIQAWLAMYTSSYTQQTYLRAVSLFNTWLAETFPGGMLNVTAAVIDRFTLHLRRQELPPASQRLCLAACSSFYSYLQRHDYLTHNYFKGAKRPKQDRYKTSDDVPVHSTIEIMQRQLLIERELCEGRGFHQIVRQAIYLYPILDMLTQYGFREGALPTLRILANGTYHIRSKGSELVGELLPSSRQILQEANLDAAFPFKGYKEKTIQKAMYRFCSRLVRQGFLHRVYNVHSFRHYFAVTFYKRTGNIFELSRRLGHSSVSITQIYLASFVDQQIQALLTKP